MSYGAFNSIEEQTAFCKWLIPKIKEKYPTLWDAKMYFYVWDLTRYPSARQSPTVDIALKLLQRFREHPNYDQLLLDARYNFIPNEILY